MVLSSGLVNRPILSLRTGSPVALALRPIINPNNLKIEGFYCQDNRSKQQLVLVESDIREIITQGFVINDFDVLSEPGDLVRLKPIIGINFELMGKQVVTESKQRVGKINDFATDNSTFYIQKLYAGQSLVKGFSTGQLSIDRGQVVEITNKKIVISELEKPVKGAVPATAPIQ